MWRRVRRQEKQIECIALVICNIIAENLWNTMKRKIYIHKFVTHGLPKNFTEDHETKWDNFFFKLILKKLALNYSKERSHLFYDKTRRNKKGCCQILNIYKYIQNYIFHIISYAIFLCFVFSYYFVIYYFKNKTCLFVRSDTCVFIVYWLVQVLCQLSHYFKDVCLYRYSIYWKLVRIILLNMPECFWCFILFNVRKY